jgi:hypothetical protein
MKTTLTILIAGLIFLMVPVIASAHGDHDRDRHKSYKVYVDKDHGHQKHQNWKKTAKKQHRQKKHLKRELREIRRDKRHDRRHDRRHYRRGHYAYSDVMVGFPHVVFRFGW